jgi:hypothetical protein
MKTLPDNPTMNQIMSVLLLSDLAATHKDAVVRQLAHEARHDPTARRVLLDRLQDLGEDECAARLAKWARVAG